jgi:hypothetical protein
VHHLQQDHDDDLFDGYDDFLSQDQVKKQNGVNQLIQQGKDDIQHGLKNLFNQHKQKLISNMQLQADQLSEHLPVHQQQKPVNSIPMPANQHGPHLHQQQKPVSSIQMSQEQFDHHHHNHKGPVSSLQLPQNTLQNMQTMLDLVNSMQLPANQLPLSQTLQPSNMVTNRLQQTSFALQQSLGGGSLQLDNNQIFQLQSILTPEQMHSLAALQQHQSGHDAKRQNGRVCKAKNCSYCTSPNCGACGNCLYPERRNKCIRR